MSPVGGVGINLAIQDAVATANLLYMPLKQGSVAPADLEQLQRRREYPARITQKMQIFLQNRFLNNVLRNQRSKAPLVSRMIVKLPLFSRLPARFVGMGVRPEHVQTPNTPA
jgi:2-polyprenyl-6-methoxyphenol hydroxylase-like FAD-dependent oxidoreductase